ncbi:MAG: SRPBCC domain-containing protein [Paracoccaceae bacterium]|nr:MAG: SRPBCC domain-containing protein [Paracoccaceae bacterium]
MSPDRPAARGRTDVAERLIPAPRDRLFSCWTDPAMLVHWLPPRGMSGRVELFDPRPGRPFRIVLTHDDPAVRGKSGGASDVVAGQFVTVDPPAHLAFVSRFRSDDPQFQGEMRMDWQFEPRPGGTLVRIVATGVPPGISAQDHAAGMGSSLAQLAALVE